MTRWTRSFALCIALVMLLPLSVSAQAIAGIVTDASGGVMPGVTVEASSSALIEQTRSVVTNDAGRFSIVNLRPGTYTVTFTLSGFRTVRREGIETDQRLHGQRECGARRRRRRGSDHRRSSRARCGRAERCRAARLHARHAGRAADRSHAGSDSQHHPRHLARLLRHEFPRHQRFSDHGGRHARVESDWRGAQPDHCPLQQQHVSGVQLLDQHRQRRGRAAGDPHQPDSQGRRQRAARPICSPPTPATTGSRATSTTTCGRRASPSRRRRSSCGTSTRASADQSPAIVCGSRRRIRTTAAILRWWAASTMPTRRRTPIVPTRRVPPSTSPAPTASCSG